MPLFDAYVMVDWAGGDGRRGGSSDCIWIAHGHRMASAPMTVSPRSRTEAEAIVRSLLLPFARPDAGRILIGADFAYGFPAGFASLLPGAEASPLPPWRAVWRYLGEHIEDDLGARPGELPTNRSNRFDVASAINAVASATAGAGGPFFCLPRAGERAFIPQRRPRQPFACPRGALAPLRLTDRRAGSDTPFRLFGTGSVGSQALTGIPRLARLRDDPRLSRHSAVWPFETGWAVPDGSWHHQACTILHAEIYPSLRAPARDAVKDRGQVRAMWRWARDLDEEDLLLAELAIPEGIRGGSVDDVTIRSEEGWILGCPPPRVSPGRERTTGRLARGQPCDGPSPPRGPLTGATMGEQTCFYWWRGSIMTTTIPGALVLGTVLALFPLAARPGATSASPALPGAAASREAPVLVAQANGPTSDSPPPDSASPTPPEPPSPPPATAPSTEAPDHDSALEAQSSGQAVPSGQWVYTQQYGWVWMPYADTYTYYPPEDYGEPYMYVYAPAYGWSWVVAPWLWGWGPWPYFGIHGVWHYGWYGRWWGYPRWRSYPWRWHRTAPFRPGFPVRGVAPAPHPVRPFAPGVRPAPRPSIGGVRPTPIAPRPSTGGAVRPAPRGGGSIHRR